MLDKMNRLGRERIPFLFVLDFELKNPLIIPLSEVDPNEIMYDMEGLSNSSIVSGEISGKEWYWQKYPVSEARYYEAFQFVVEQELKGNSFLVNLTFPTRVETDLTLQEMFFQADAKFKLWLKDQLVVFSPESFVTIRNNQISSFPMKGTIKADLPNAGEVILNDRKEMAEHVTIVDLIRNDLSRVADQVGVSRFRYLDRINSRPSPLLQVSSEVTGNLRPDWRENMGALFEKLLPAGSISGAPKPKTIEIIKEAENYDRGYFTGVFGLFDGENLSSAVMIRYMEQIHDQKFFKSGGGITIYSEAASEYQELIDKVYVPIPGNHFSARPAIAQPGMASATGR